MNRAKQSLCGAVVVLFFVAGVPHFFTADAFAAGYKIPEQSANAVGLAAAYVANASGPDSAYYNPANMVWSDERAAIETSLNYVYLPNVNFRGSVFGDPVNADSKSEHFLLPNMHYISPKIGKARFGFSVVYPFGLSKRWDHPSQQLFAEEFTLETIELDLSVAFEVSEQFAMGWGIRGIRSEGKVVRRGNLPTESGLISVSGEMEGDDFSTGYVLALSARPIRNLSMAVTYRSEVKPTLEGNAQLSAADGSTPYSGPVELEIVLPASFQVASAYTFRRTVFEFVYEKTYWGKYQELDFEFATPLVGPVQPAFFDDPLEKSYSDADTYRLGFTYHYNPKWTLLLGVAIDEGAAPAETLNFELPDADALVYSTGFKYQAGERFSFAMAYITSQKKDRSFTNTEARINGEFKSSAHVVNASIVYVF